MTSNRPLQDVDDDVLAACLCIGALADHIAEHGMGSTQVLMNLERAADGLKRLMAERQAVMTP